MDFSESSLNKLDVEFDRISSELKTFVLKLSLKNDRQRCALWIKKFYEPTGSTISAKKNRNQYAQLMLSMLKRGLLEGPFLSKPEYGPLPSFPVYLSMYFDSESAAEAMDKKVPDWVTSELSYGSDVASGRQLVDDSVFSSRDTVVGHVGSSRVQVGSNGFMQDADRHQTRAKPAFESPSVFNDADNFRTSNLFHSFPQSLRPSQIPADTARDFALDTFAAALREDGALTRAQNAELEIRTKMIESKFQEESLRLQHQHDCNVKKILDRKNAEIEEIKQHYKAKSLEHESVVSQMEKKVSHLQRELGAVQELRDQQIADLQRQTEENAMSKQSLLDKKLHDMAMDYEQQKYELQKRHTVAIQELMDETNGKLGKMQADYDQLTESTSATIRELESRVLQLSLEVETTTRARQQLEQRKVDLEMQVDKLGDDLTEAQARLSAKENELRKVRGEHEIELRSAKNKSDSAIESLKNDNRIAQAKSADVIRGLEQQISELKQVLAAADLQRQKEIREMEMVFQQDKLQLEQLHETKVGNVQMKFDERERQSAKQVKKLEKLISQKDAEIQRLTMMQIEQAELAQRTLDEFKVQVEKNSARMYDEMKQQLDKVEGELSRTKHAREKQARDAERQCEELLRIHTEQLTELKLKLEMERARHVEDLQAQCDVLRAEKDKELADSRDQFNSDLANAERRARERSEKDTKARVQLEAQIQRLKDELIELNQQHKDELMELRLARDQEKLSFESTFNSQTAKLKSQMEEQRLELEKKHSIEIEKLLENTNSRLRELDIDYSTRNSRAAETISDLQTTVEKLKEEMNRRQLDFEHQMTTSDSQRINDSNSLKQQYSSRILDLQRELSAHKDEIQRLERQRYQQQLDAEEQLTQVRSQYEDRLRGMVKTEVREELENTISSLRMQVSVLQQRAALLQEDLESCNHTTARQVPVSTRPSSAVQTRS